MGDPIERQAAIDAIQGIDRLATLSDNDAVVRMSAVEHVLFNLPSAQPYTDAEIQKMQDIEQAELQKAYELGKQDAQSEIIRCKDCGYWDADPSCSAFPNLHLCRYWTAKIATDADNFCGRAERRTDG